MVPSWTQLALEQDIAKVPNMPVCKLEMEKFILKEMWQRV